MTDRELARKVYALLMRRAQPRTDRKGVERQGLPSLPWEVLAEQLNAYGDALFRAVAASDGWLVLEPHGIIRAVARVK